MRNRDAITQSILLARAFEEADAAGVILTAAERREATERARATGGDVEERAATRAAELLAILETRVAGLARLRRATRVPAGAIALVPIAAFAVGVATNALGPVREVNVLAFPLLGLVVWNVAVYAVVLALALLRRRPGRAAARSPGPTGRALAALAAPRAGADPRQSAIAARALRRYAGDWGAVSAPRAAARLRLALHLGAAALAGGVVAGMYARGIAFEYRATWESTFLDAETAAALLRVVLAPAALVLGRPLPDAAELAAMRAPAGTADAAPWIHLWAVTAAVVIVAPRLALAAAAWLGARDRGRLPIDPLAGSFRALLAPDRGAGLTIDVLPYSCGLSGRSADAVRELLHEVFGARAEVRVQEPTTYGDELAAEDGGAQGGPRAEATVLVFALAQPPETEVHARFARELARQRHGGQPDRVLAIVDGSGWQERLGDSLGRRLAERRRAWDLALADAGIAPLHLDLAADLPGDAASQAESRLPAGLRAGTIGSVA